VVSRDEVWRKEYFSYRFDTPLPRRPRRAEDGLQRGEIRTTEPDAKVLEEIYLHELVWRIPRAGA
jgi:hypothetical protein